MNDPKEEAAIQVAFEQQIGLLYTTLLDASVLAKSVAEVEEACGRFRKGLVLVRRAKELAIQMISEQYDTNKGDSDGR